MATHEHRFRARRIRNIDHEMAYFYGDERPRGLRPMAGLGFDLTGATILASEHGESVPFALGCAVEIDAAIGVENEAVTMRLVGLIRRYPDPRPICSRAFGSICETRRP